MTVSSEELLQTVVAAAEDKKAHDIVALNLTGYFACCGLFCYLSR